MAALQPAVASGNSQRACINCSVQSHCLARGLDGERLNQFENARGSIRVLRRGQHLYRAGAGFDALYMVRSGTLKVSAASEDGTEQIVGFHLPGELLGLDGIEGGCHETTAVALETSSVCAFPFHRLVALCRELRDLQAQAWRLTGREIMSRQKLLLTIGQKGAEARLGTFLISLSARLKRLGYSGTEFRMAMSRQEIADYLGLSLETVCRVLTRFQDAGLIIRDRRFVKLLDVAALAVRAGGAEPLEEKRLVA
ncbi:MAG: helix-turn-helix domain-containing protein [Gammaproteobacteria bacterium]|nr:helix-turn-helix domain-containing protein [Gammaproteobacteria bacterium]